MNTMNGAPGALRDLLDEAFDRRRAAGSALIDQAGALALAGRALAARFRTGGRLLTFGTGSAAADAQHIAVEFMHPVIVGKRALPALSLAGDPALLSDVAARDGADELFAGGLRVHGRPGDIALGIALDGRCPSVARGLRAARNEGLLTLALAGGERDGAVPRAAEHRIVVDSTDPLAVKESLVTAYHVLWEMVHVFLSDTPRDPAALIEDVRQSTQTKAREILALRERLRVELADALLAAALALAGAAASGGRVFAFGNGGSATGAQAVAALFARPPRGRPVPALALPADIATVTALANDVGFEVVYARQLAALAAAGDVAIALSTRGNSANVICALEEARQRSLLTIGLAGYDGGRMAESGLVDHLLVVPSSAVHRIQEAQTTIHQVLWELTQAALAGRSRR